MSDTSTIPAHHKRLLEGPGLRLALWGQRNHSEEWDEKRDQQVLEHARENSKQFPAFVQKLKKEIRGEESGE